jgi:hypothetical protein
MAMETPSCSGSPGVHGRARYAQTRSDWPRSGPIGDDDDSMVPSPIASACELEASLQSLDRLLVRGGDEKIDERDATR